MPENPPSNPEIEQALKEFEQGGGYKAVKFYNETEAPNVIKFVMKYSGGLVTQQQATYVALGFCLFVIFISIYVYVSNKPLSPPPRDQIIEIAGPDSRQ